MPHLQFNRDSRSCFVLHSCPSPRLSTPPLRVGRGFTRVRYMHMPVFVECALSRFYSVSFSRVGWEEAVEEDGTGTIARRAYKPRRARPAYRQAGCMSGRSGGRSCSSGGGTAV